MLLKASGFLVVVLLTGQRVNNTKKVFKWFLNL